MLFAPIAAVLAWRYSGPLLRKYSLYTMVLSALSMAGWFGYLTIEGSEVSTSFFDRIMNSIGVMIMSINFPILQFLLGTAIVVAWPRRFEFKPKTVDSQTTPLTEKVLPADGDGERLVSEA